jgi:hypothetical protein
MKGEKVNSFLVIKFVEEGKKLEKGAIIGKIDFGYV